MSDSVATLWAEAQRVVAESIDAHSQGYLFGDLPERFARPGHQQSVHPFENPTVDKWLSEAVRATPNPWRTLAQSLQAATPEIPWLRSYEHLESSPELEAFRERYSYQLFAGPLFRGYAPPLLMDDLLVGFTLQAPDVYYPEHHHAPAEMYGVISGTLEWLVGTTWSTVGPGDVIVHRSHESHAMRTGPEPALTWVIWADSPHSAVYMPSMDPAHNTMAPKVYP